MTLEMELAKLSKQINDLRRLHSILSSYSFKELYDATADKTTIDRLISQKDVSSVETWIKSVEPLDCKPVKELRAIAHDLGIYNWHNLPKDELLCRIQKKQTALSNAYSPSIPK